MTIAMEDDSAVIPVFVSSRIDPKAGGHLPKHYMTRFGS
jgi:hypothetical protein